VTRRRNTTRRLADDPDRSLRVGKRTRTQRHPRPRAARNAPPGTTDDLAASPPDEIASWAAHVAGIPLPAALRCALDTALAEPLAKHDAH
jgi:hypothetical protein